MGLFMDWKSKTEQSSICPQKLYGEMLPSRTVILATKQSNMHDHSTRI